MHKFHLGQAVSIAPAVERWHLVVRMSSPPNYPNVTASLNTGFVALLRSTSEWCVRVSSRS